MIKNENNKTTRVELFPVCSYSHICYNTVQGFVRKTHSLFFTNRVTEGIDYQSFVHQHQSLSDYLMSNRHICGSERATNTILSSE